MNICFNCDSATINPKFCSRSCSASYNNRKFPRRSVEGTCSRCSLPIKSKNKYCNKCRSVVLLIDPSLTKAEFLTNDTQRYRRIRDHARRKAKAAGLLQECNICGYSNHVHTCHKKPIQSYLDTATLNEINDLSNLIGLCPNHHWEFDNGLL